MATFWATPQGGDGTLWQLVEGTTDLYFTCVGVDGDDDRVYAWKASDGTFKRLITEDTEKGKNALITMQTNVTETVISAINTPVKVVGTWAEQFADSFTTDSTGRITYTGAEKQKFFVFSGFEGDVVGGANTDYTEFFAINGTIIAPSGTGDRLDGADKRYFNNEYIIELSTNDYIEKYIQNNVNTRNITVQLAKFGVFALPYMV